MLKCRKCAAHDVEVAVRGHARTCPYRLCPCEKCVKVVNKRLSSVKRRYKNSDVVFINVECNSGNVRVQAIPKTLIDTLKSDNINPAQIVSTKSTPEKCQPPEPSSTADSLQKSPSEPSSATPPQIPEFSSNLMQFLPYLTMSPEQQLNFCSIYAWMMQSARHYDAESALRYSSS
uniref:DM domain-containing protein n=1 Tax=Panagrellus redivivus TaxID=6233 RepID=A0A7E4ULR8_PANRE